MGKVWRRLPRSLVVSSVAAYFTSYCTVCGSVYGVIRQARGAVSSAYEARMGRVGVESVVQEGEVRADEAESDDEVSA